jgi:MFS family permease
VPAGAVIVGAATGIFIAIHTALWTAFVTMIVSGLGLGLTFAAMPGLIVQNVPAVEVGSALGLYTVTRFVGYALGSALSAAILGAYTPSGSHSPTETGFVVVLFAGLALSLGAAALTAFALRRAASVSREVMPARVHSSLLTEGTEYACSSLVSRCSRPAAELPGPGPGQYSGISARPSPAGHRPGRPTIRSRSC